MVQVAGERDAPDPEHEITPEMVAAGVGELWSYRQEENDSALVVAVYIAMRRLACRASTEGVDEAEHQIIRYAQP